MSLLANVCNVHAVTVAKVPCELPHVLIRLFQEATSSTESPSAHRV